MCVCVNVYATLLLMSLKIVQFAARVIGRLFRDSVDFPENLPDEALFPSSPGKLREN